MLVPSLATLVSVVHYLRVPFLWASLQRKMAGFAKLVARAPHWQIALNKVHSCGERLASLLEEKLPPLSLNVTDSWSELWKKVDAAYCVCGVACQVDACDGGLEKAQNSLFIGNWFAEEVLLSPLTFEALPRRDLLVQEVTLDRNSVHDVVLERVAEVEWAPVLLASAVEVGDLLKRASRLLQALMAYCMHILRQGAHV